MSLVIARTAAKKALLNYLKGSCLIAGISSAFSNASVYAQENPFRMSSIQLPAILAVPTINLKQDAEKSGNELKTEPRTVDLIRFKSGQSPSSADSTGDKNSALKNIEPKTNDATKEKAREPIALPALSVPNTSIAGVGSGATPEDQVAGRLPSLISLPVGSDRYGYWAFESKTWAPPVFCHQPLYFEDTMLEKHGHERFPCIQPVVSGARFFTNIAFLPYQSYLQRPLEDRYNTGHYRAGSAAPALRQRAPYDAGAMRLQLLTTGTAVLAVQP